MASAPASIIDMAMTHANTGRSRKNFDIPISLLRLGARPGRPRGERFRCKLRARARQTKACRGASGESPRKAAGIRTPVGFRTAGQPRSACVRSPRGSIPGMVREIPILRRSLGVGAIPTEGRRMSVYRLRVVAGARRRRTPRRARRRCAAIDGTRPWPVAHGERSGVRWAPTRQACSPTPSPGAGAGHGGWGRSSAWSPALPPAASTRCSRSCQRVRRPQPADPLALLAHVDSGRVRSAPRLRTRIFAGGLLHATGSRAARRRSRRRGTRGLDASCDVVMGIAATRLGAASPAQWRGRPPRAPPHRREVRGPNTRARIRPAAAG